MFAPTLSKDKLADYINSLKNEASQMPIFFFLSDLPKCENGRKVALFKMVAESRY